MRRIALIAALFALGACSQQGVIEKFSSAEDVTATKAYIAVLRAHDYGEIERHIDPTLSTPALHGMLVKMAALIPDGEPTSVKLVGAHRFTATNSTTQTAVTKQNNTYEYEFGGTWILINVALQHEGAVTTIIGLNAMPEPASLETQNRFRLSGRTAIHYAILAWAVAAVLITIVALILCARAKHERRKWLWIVFILFGFGKVYVNWTTGQLGWGLISFLLFSAGAARQMYGPWIVTAAIPVGAIVYVLRRRKDRKTAAEVDPQESK
jgi:hypothetical protein